MLMNRGFFVGFWGQTKDKEGPVRKEMRKGAGQARDLKKIEVILQWIQVVGFLAQGLRVEKISGSPGSLYELKMTGCGAEYRFIAVFAPWLDDAGRPVLVLLRFLNKKTRRLPRTDIETAEARARGLSGEQA